MAGSRAVNQSTRRSQIVELDDALPPLLEIPNPENLKDISKLKLTDTNFREWKNLKLAELNYYGMNQIINGTHGPPTGVKLAYYQTTECLFDLAFAASLPTHVFEATKTKTTLREKWFAILKNYTHTDLGKITTELFNIKLEVNEKIEDFTIRLCDIWESLERCGHPIDKKWQIEQLLTKMDPIFPAEVRELRRSRDIRTLKWDYVVKVFKEVEYTRPAPAAPAPTASAATESHQSSNKPDHSRGRSRSRSRSPRPQDNSRFQRRKPEYLCFACHQEGHLLRDCPDLKDFREYRKSKQNQQKPTGLAGYTHWG